MRDAIAALPVENAVIDGEAVVIRTDNSFDFEALRSRQGQAAFGSDCANLSARRRSRGVRFFKNSSSSDMQ
jgi:ATP-dependent DNA ligase